MKIYAVGAGSYSDYRIDSVWSKRSAAQERADLLNEGGSYGQEAEVEVYDVDPDLTAEHVVHTLFATIDGTTGEMVSGERNKVWCSSEVSSDPYGVTLKQDKHRRVSEYDQWKITIKEPTEERCRKVLSEVVAQTKARIDATGPLVPDTPPAAVRRTLAAWIFQVWRGWGVREAGYSWMDGEMEPYRLAPDGTQRTYWQDDDYVEPTMNSGGYKIYLVATDPEDSMSDRAWERAATD